MSHFQTLDVFTEQPFGGNPLAVFTDARSIPENSYQSIAREMNLSETVFVLPPDDPQCKYRFRIFTPVRELDFAGHPVVGSACALAAEQTQEQISFKVQLNAGITTIDLARKGHFWKARFQVPRLPESGPAAPSVEILEKALGLKSGDIHLGTSPIAFSCGAPILFLELASRDALSRCKIDLSLYEMHLANYWAPEVMPFVIEGQEIHCRMFAPALGIPEDPATGGAAAAITGFLIHKFHHELPQEGDWPWRIHQGYEMGRPSLIELTMNMKQGKLNGIQIAGHSVPMSRGQILAFDS
ncbi:MAG: hypothetical protein CMF59_10740 [Leptospiraceae bacterium]|nr:hypothetical protein [Leptospiraceae bacterium]